jgi:PPOX class probable F420-dependent enzyme
VTSGAFHSSDLDKARYISLTSFKKDGSPVSTPVWITGSGGRYAFTTGDKAWKTKRILRNPTIEARVCDMRGRVKPDTTIHSGTATISTLSADITSAERSLSAKYGWQFRATRLVDSLKGRLGRGPTQKVVAVHLTVPNHSEA